MLQPQSRHFFCLLAVVGLSFCLAGGAIGRDKAPVVPPEPNNPVLDRPPVDSIGYPVIDWPTWWGLQQTGQVNASFTSWGTFGTGFNRSYPAGEPWSYVNFESQPRSNADYMWGGAIWVGGIVGTDTLVSVGADCWQYVSELFPPAGASGTTAGSVRSFSYSTSSSMRAELTDTTNADQTYAIDIFAHCPHRPLNVRLDRDGSYASGSPVASGIYLYRLMVGNTKLTRKMPLLK